MRFHCYIFDRPCKFVDFKNRMQLYLKVNIKQQKCHANCIGGMLKRIVCGCLEKYIMMEVFNPKTQSREHRPEQSRGDTRCHTAVGIELGRLNDPRFRYGEKSKCTKLANVESKYDPRMKKK